VGQVREERPVSWGDMRVPRQDIRSEQEGEDVVYPGVCQRFRNECDMCEVFRSGRIGGRSMEVHVLQSLSRLSEMAEQPCTSGSKR
jgi:hypothetical protein